jgi:signal transduction histidine kinase
VDWRAGPAYARADEGRVAQALGNLLANAREHGGGEAVLRAERTRGGLTLVVANPERGRGLAIASAAAQDIGGALAVGVRDGVHEAQLELAVAE